MLPAVASEFREVFERAYADEMDWRLSRGGATEEEIRRMALASGEEYSDEQIAATLELQRWEAIESLNTALRKRFAEETTMSVAEWDRISDELLFIHDDLSADELRDMVEDWFSEDPDQYRWPEDLPGRETFATVIAQIPENRRPRRVGTVSEPVEADVYTASQEWMEAFGDEEW